MRPTFDSPGAIAVPRPRALDYLTLTKPELTFLSVLTALAGFWMGSAGAVQPLLLLKALVGTALVGGGAGTLNQFLERDYDAVMKRTENRPLPSGRLAPAEVLVFGLLLSTVGIAMLTFFVNFLTGLLASLTLSTYLFLYTPLKRVTPLATLVGAVPGALPPVMGWAAACNEISLGAGLLFGILFFWQMPHFLSLAWLYRKDYARAGYRLLTVVDESGKATGSQVMIHASLLLLVSVVPTILGVLGLVYGVSALLLGGCFLGLAWKFATGRSSANARRLFVASLLYLPTLIAAMIVDRL